ncbi:MAG: Ig-like domain-containing protein [Patescibacteria group bacterium]
MNTQKRALFILSILLFFTPLLALAQIFPTINPGFESGLQEWVSGVNGGTVRAVSNAGAAHSGNYYAELTSPVGEQPLLFRKDALDRQHFLVTPGQAITFGGWAYRVSGNGYVGYALAFLDANKTNITYVGSNIPNESIASWTNLTRSYIVPAGKRYVSVYAQIYQNTVPSVARFDDTTLSFTALNTYPTPTALPIPRTYTVAQTVRLSALNSSYINYTINGTVPTCAVGTVYTTPISVATTKTIKAIACYPTGSSAVATFAYIINLPDTTLPTVFITAPLASAVISSPVPFSATANDAVGVVGVQFKSSMSTVIFDDTTFPYTTTLNTTSLPNGPLTIYAVARDAAGNKATSTVTVMVSNVLPAPIANPPASTYPATQNVILIAPGSSIRYTTTTTDPTCTTGTLYTTPIHITVSTTIKAIACYPTESSSVASFAYVINLSDTTLPTVSITAPANASTVSGTTTPINANATDNVGVVGVQFKLDGVNLGAEDLVYPYSTDWNTTLTGNGAHALTAVARDAAGNTMTSATMIIAVNNASYAVSQTISYDDHQALIARLLAQLDRLQKQLPSMSGGYAQINVAPQAYKSQYNQSCIINRPLYRGLRGADVVCLQQALISRSLLSPDSATGYFGALTEAAVKQFQNTSQIISYGDPQTTGYGLVGPRTRATLLEY